MKLTITKSECKRNVAHLPGATKKSDCRKHGERLLIASKKEAKKKFIAGSKIQYCVTVEPFPMAYAYAEEMSHGEKFMDNIFSFN